MNKLLFTVYFVVVVVVNIFNEVDVASRHCGLSGQFEDTFWTLSNYPSNI